MKKGATEIYVVVDKSDFMLDKTVDTINCLNSFLDTKRMLPGQTKVTIALCDTLAQKFVERKSIKSVRGISKRSYKPGGSCAIIDNIASCMDDLGIVLRDTPEENRPEKVIFVVLSSGADNASKKCKLDKLADMIDHQETIYSWEFVFLGAPLAEFRKARKPRVSKSNKPVADKEGKKSTKSSRRVAKSVDETVAIPAQIEDVLIDTPVDTPDTEPAVVTPVQLEIQEIASLETPETPPEQPKKATRTRKTSTTAKAPKTPKTAKTARTTKTEAVETDETTEKATKAPKTPKAPKAPKETKTTKAGTRKYTRSKKTNADLQEIVVSDSTDEDTATPQVVDAPIEPPIDAPANETTAKKPGRKKATGTTPRSSKKTAEKTEQQA